MKTLTTDEHGWTRMGGNLKDERRTSNFQLPTSNVEGRGA
jgi:hypothetical protein